MTDAPKTDSAASKDPALVDASKPAPAAPPAADENEPVAGPDVAKK